MLGKKGESPEDALRDHGGAAAAAAASAAPVAEPKASPAVAAAPTPAANTADPIPAPTAADREADARVPASPVARKLAREAGIALHAIQGSGPHGRVIKADVEKAASSAGGPARAVGVASADADADGRPYVSRPDEVIPHSLMRKTIAKRMVQATTEAPHFYLTVDIDMQEAAKLRASYNKAIEGKVSFNDLVIMAVARSLRQHPEVNAHYTPDGIVRVGDIHVGVAVAVEGGLIVPVVRHAE